MTTLSTEKSLAAGPLNAKARDSEVIEEAIQTVKYCRCCAEPMILVPRLVCSRCSAPMDIKCQVYQSKGVWYAECLTFNLLSKGESKDDAIRRIQIAMFSYIAVVVDGNESTRGLIPRPAPLSSWVRYYAHEALGRLAYLIGRKIPLMIRSVPIEDVAAEKILHCP